MDRHSAISHKGKRPCEFLIAAVTIRSSGGQEIVTVFENFRELRSFALRRGMNLSDNKRAHEHDNGRR